MELTVDVARVRKEYTMRGLHRHELDPNPFEQFKLWFDESVRTAGDREPNAMTLATASRQGMPSARIASTVWVASNSPMANQIAAIQNQVGG